MDGWNVGRMDGSTADVPTDRQKGDFVDVCRLFRHNRHFTVHFDLIGISAAYFDLIDVLDFMTVEKKINFSLKTA